MATVQNGWTVINKPGKYFRDAGSGMSVGVRGPSVAVIFAWIGYRWHTEIEPVTYASGWRSTSYGGGIGKDSNHCAGLAVDWNGSKHPYERDPGPWHSGFTSEQIKRLDSICRSITDNSGNVIIREGIHFDVCWRDGMHIEMQRPNASLNDRLNHKKLVSQKQITEAAAKVRAHVKRIQKTVGAKQDGYAGPAMLKAVKTWQQKNHLVVDGIFGPKSQKKAGWTKPVTHRKFPLPKGHYFGVNDKRPHSHSGVFTKDRANIRLIQKKVGVTADGIYGEKTKSAVIKFQAKHHLLKDGEVGPNTWKAIF